MSSPIPRDELTVLAAFAAVADDRSFTKAAIKLGVSRSAISHSMRTLEERLGLRLLARTTRSVAPTDAGERLLAQPRPALHDIQTALDEAGQLRAKPKTPRDLTAHCCISHRIGASGPVYRWEFEKRGKPVTVSVSGPFIFSDPTFTLRAALDGLGLAFLFEEHVAEHVARGRLVRVLEDWCPPFDGYFLYYPSRRHQPPALQALVNALRL